MIKRDDDIVVLCESVLVCLVEIRVRRCVLVRCNFTFNNVINIKFSVFHLLFMFTFSATELIQVFEQHVAWEWETTSEVPHPLRNVLILVPACLSFALCAHCIFTADGVHWVLKSQILVQWSEAWCRNLKPVWSLIIQFNYDATIKYWFDTHLRKMLHFIAILIFVWIP